ncbi:hypothetical protein [Psychromonas sp. GE-S-Ul-11]|uniref:hypothetical protein n=1 Tax=Psychromonas sp. GE-S-Ul-11 TaxID=3241170 RepID=UPI00390CB8C4
MNREYKNTFTNIYKNNVWNSDESRSGPGSEKLVTKTLVKGINSFLSQYEISSIFDCPCGDFNWFKNVDYSNVTYLGGDIVKEIIQDNLINYFNLETNFIEFDLTSQNMPASDVWLCRDCFIHLSNKDIKKVLNNFIESHIEYCLLTTMIDVKNNKDILTGQWRLLNLQAPPFNFPIPLEVYEDSKNASRHKVLALWSKEQIKTVKWLKYD